MPDPEPYEEQTADDYAERFVQGALSTPTRRGVLLRGTCPRCAHPMGFQVVTEIFQTSAACGPGPASAATEEKPLLCTCELDHPGRPAAGEGCGAYWNVRLTRPGS
ncbi:MAG: hypothetical protein AB7V44_02335 [Pseudonocardia sp.]